MKKILFLILATFLVLAACGNEEESKLDDTKETKSEDKESTKDDKESDEEKDKSDEKQKSDDKSSEEVATQDESTEEAQSQEQVNTQEQQSTQQAPVQSQEQVPVADEQATQEQQRTEIDLNSLPGGDFTTEGMSKDAQMQIEELTRQKDFERLPQKDYNDQVSAIMNSEMN
ncbi:MAG: hypothetical protein L0L09_13640 [Staphylococcus equorum]|uniref:hypothetical protein n=1 Tax=Staphylococcus TaxID=1279 RepID=UPI000853A6FC|nr:hypothetical protein [Staphylococcus equorum]MDG0821704.1 hypothetical protein [Staphylococcus equorum]MDG0837451.1 hypothetical protein [Staphylococcus equorum]MDK9872012.1 hypothetical protein [Staphylococcus equorum]MDK9876879.1 hypothetical protein [Staphylococcus equorum]MDN5829969.1 hypothetical protein [Staphylococcus equorum]